MLISLRSSDAGLGFDQGKENPLLADASRTGDLDRDRLVRDECREPDPLGAPARIDRAGAVSSAQGINVVFALPKKLFVPWLNVVNIEGSARRFWFERDCRVVVFRVGERPADGLACSPPKLGRSNFGSFGFGSENELGSRAVDSSARDSSERLVPVARGGRTGSLDSDAAGFLNGLGMVGNLKPSARAGMQNVPSSRQLSAKAVILYFTKTLLLASNVAFDRCV